MYFLKDLAALERIVQKQMEEDEAREDEAAAARTTTARPGVGGDDNPTDETP